MSKQIVTLQLSILVTIDLNGTPVEDIKQQLRNIGPFCYSEGFFTGSLPAEVEAYSTEVELLAKEA